MHGMIQAGLDMQGVLILLVIVFSIFSELVSRAKKARKTPPPQRRPEPMEQPGSGAPEAGAPEIPRQLRELIESMTGATTVDPQPVAPPQPPPPAVPQRRTTMPPRTAASTRPVPRTAPPMWDETPPAPYSPPAHSAPSVVLRPGSSRPPARALKDRSVPLPQLQLPAMREGLSGGIDGRARAKSKLRYLRNPVSLRQAIVARMVLSAPVGLTPGCPGLDLNDRSR